MHLEKTNPLPKSHYLPDYLANNKRFKNLQISIVNKSDVDKVKRFDSETFKPEYLEIEKKLKTINSLYLSEVVGQYTNGAEVREFKKEGIPYIRVSNTSNDFFVNFNDIKFISKKDFEKQKEKYLLNQNDLILNRSGTLGFCQIVNFENALFSSHNIRLSNIKINSYYLCSFLNSNFGKKQILRYSNGAVVPEINHLGLGLILIPLLPETFQLQIEKIVKQAKANQDQAKSLYQEAEEILLAELGLVDYQTSNALTFETTKKKVEQARRFDAEYFQPKYEEMIKQIEKYKNGFDEIGNIITWKKGIEVGSQEYTAKGKSFVRVSDFSSFEIREPSKKISEKLFVEIKNDFQPQKGDILFTKDGTIGIAQVLNENIDGVLSGAFLRLNLTEEYKNFEKECLCLILNSIICKLQVQQLSGGALISHLKPTDFEKIKIPLISPEIQQKIAANIQQSHQLRKSSKELLELAKSKVEAEIEKESLKE